MQKRLKTKKLDRFFWIKSKQLHEFKKSEFEVKPEDNLVEEEIEAARKKFHL